MASRRVGNRSDTVTVSTPRGAIEVVRQQWRSERAGAKWAWEWLARRQGQRQWREGSSAREAIRHATLLPPGKQPRWLLAAVAEADRAMDAQGVEPTDEPLASGEQE